MNYTPIYDELEQERIRKEFFADPSVAERQAIVDELIAKVKDPNDPYDAHHGTDRSEDSLAWAAENDPETYVRVLGKIEKGE